MRTLKFLFATLLSFFIFSCSGDDNSIDTANLSGEWELEAFNYEGTSSVSQNGQTYSSSYWGESSDIDAKVNFKDNNTLESEGSYLVTLTTNFEGGTTEQILPIENFSGSGTFSVDGNTLSLQSQVNSNPQPGLVNPFEIS